MPGFMGDDADHFVRGARLGEETGVHEDALAASHEGVDAVIGDDIDVNVTRIDAGRLEDGPRDGAKITFDLGITDEVGAAVFRLLCEAGGCQRNGKAG